MRNNIGSRSIRLNLVTTLAVCALLIPVSATFAQSDTNTTIPDAYLGNYRIGQDHILGIDWFITDAKEKILLISDYRSGVVRRLFPISETEFVMGPGFEVQSPVELRVRFVKDEQDNVTGISLKPTDGVESFAKRIPLKEEEVTFNSGDVTLKGRLIVPATKGPHPAIILLHGSGPLTRYSFGSYPHFFSSLGFAVLIFDKRGSGASNGTLFDVSTGGSPGELLAAYYPHALADDALAAFNFLKGRREIDPRQIGFWGSSEGGMLTTQVAARSKDVAFIINSSGFIGPFWETLLYQVEKFFEEGGKSKVEIDQALALNKLGLEVSRTGTGYELYLKQRQAHLLARGLGRSNSLEQMRWEWEHRLSFDPSHALKNVTCPVLGVFGELDNLTDAAAATKNMREVLSKAGHKDFTLKIFPNAGHSLREMPSKARMAPGVFDTLRSWLLARVRVAKSVAN